MNNFTKEELEILHIGLSLQRSNQGKQMFPELKEKLESMIQNYCQHKSTNFDDGIYYCDDCGVCVDV